MTRRGLRKYVDDLLAGRRPKPFEPDDFEAAQLRMAIDLQAAGVGADQPRPEFIDSLKSRVAQQLSDDPPTADKQSGRSATRRQVIVGTTAAATAAVAAVSVDRLLIGSAQSGDSLVPNDGSWQTVAKSADVTDGGMHSFDLGSVTGFLRRVDGRVEAVSGVCTHQGCRLWFDPSADRLRCPCHVTSFSPTGEVLTHQLPIAPKPLPHIQVRERDGVVEVLAPVRSV